MKVTATQRGFHHVRLLEPGDAFEIPDQPTRKIVPEDDEATKKAAVKGQIPKAFASSWMKPGWDKNVVEAVEGAGEPETKPDPTEAI